MVESGCAEGIRHASGVRPREASKNGHDPVGLAPASTEQFDHALHREIVLQGPDASHSTNPALAGGQRASEHRDLDALALKTPSVRRGRRDA